MRFLTKPVFSFKPINHISIFREFISLKTETLCENPHIVYTPSFTLLYSRKVEMRGTQNEGLFSGLDKSGKRRCRNLIIL